MISTPVRVLPPVPVPVPVPAWLAVAALALSGCAGTPTIEQSCGHPDLGRTVVVLERGDTTSALATLAGGCFTETPPSLVLGHDNTLLGAEGRAYVGLNEQGTLHALDADRPEDPRLGASWEVYRDQPASKLVHGIYGVDLDRAGNLWISRTEVGSLAIMKPGGALDAVIDLSNLDAGDGVPDMNGILVEGDRAYVAVGFLSYPAAGGYVVTPARAGALVVIDTTTRERLSVIDLRGRNPVHAPVRTGDPNVVLLPTPGLYDSADASDGIDRVWLDGSRETEQLIGEAELGGSVEQLVWAADDELYALVLGPEPGINPTRLVRIDPTREAGDRVTVLAEAPHYADPDRPAYVHVGLALAGDHVVLADQNQDDPRLRVHARATGEEIAAIPVKIHPPAGLLALPP